MMEWIIEAGKVAGALSAIIALISLLLYKPVIKPRLEKRRKEKEETEKFRKIVLEKLDGMLDDIADLQYERLSQAHDFYMERGWCPTSKKMQLCNMYKSYTSKGRNHLSAHYEREILDLADKPEMKE